MNVCKACGKPVGPTEVHTYPTDGAVVHKICAEFYIPEQLGEPNTDEYLPEDKAALVRITTGPMIAGEVIEHEIEIITAECVFGMNVFKDFFAGLSDFFGGRSKSSQKVLRDARKICLDELKLEAVGVKADAVIGVRLDYSEISGQGKNMLFLVASGTAVRLKSKT